MRRRARTCWSLIIENIHQTATTIHCFVLAMVLHPGVQERAQAEMDRVVGGARLPDMGDRDALPYLEAVVMEVYRCVPLAL